jgi:cell division protein FtsW (lipid II flippase)
VLPLGGLLHLFLHVATKLAEAFTELAATGTLLIAQHAFEAAGIFAKSVEATGVTVVLFSARKQDGKQAEASQCEHQQDN